MRSRGKITWNQPTFSLVLGYEQNHAVSASETQKGTLFPSGN